MKIETTRTYLREFQLDDAAAVLKFNDNRDVTRYTGDAGMITSLNDARRVITDIWHREYKLYGYARWAVVEKSNLQVIGFCGLKYIPKLGMPDIGYRFLPEYWGKGLATETAMASVEYCRAQLNVQRYFADVMEENTASVKVIRKLGLRFHQYIKEDGFTFMRFKQGSRTLLNTNQFYK